ncbi:MAG: LysE family translocator [Chloroflexota bacterium]
MLALVVVHLFAVMSPGANFLIVARNSLTYSRQTGLMTVRGVALGSLFYITIGIFGFATVISQSPPIFNVIRLLGAGYFFYTGIRALLSLRKPSRFAEQLEAPVSLTRRQAFFSGLLTSVSNATSALYFLALFTTFVPTSAAWQEKGFTALVLISITFTWYTFLALTLSRSRVRQFYRRFERWFSGLIGFLWLFLAFKLLGAS